MQDTMTSTLASLPFIQLLAGSPQLQMQCISQVYIKDIHAGRFEQCLHGTAYANVLESK